MDERWEILNALVFTDSTPLKILIVTFLVVLTHTNYSYLSKVPLQSEHPVAISEQLRPAAQRLLLP